MRKLISITLGLLVAATLSACSGMMGGDLIRSGEPVGQISVYNASRDTLTSVTVSQCSAMSHGMNRMPSGVQIRPGQSYLFRVSRGCYDVQAGWAYLGTTAYSSGVAEFDDIYVQAGRTFRLTVN